MLSESTFQVGAPPTPQPPHPRRGFPVSVSVRAACPKASGGICFAEASGPHPGAHPRGSPTGPIPPRGRGLRLSVCPWRVPLWVGLAQPRNHTSLPGPHNSTKSSLSGEKSAQPTPLKEGTSVPPLPPHRGPGGAIYRKSVGFGVGRRLTSQPVPGRS